MAERSFTLFDTAIGTCGIAWSDHGVLLVQLPEASVQHTRERLAARVPRAVEEEPPPGVRRCIEAIAGMLRGEDCDMSSVVLDMQGVPSFHRRVYEAARRIPRGATTTYGQLASDVGATGAARAVGQALGRNPFPLVVPCHRIVASSGKLCGFTAHGGIATKLRLLTMEGAQGAFCV